MFTCRTLSGPWSSTVPTSQPAVGVAPNRILYNATVAPNRILCNATVAANISNHILSVNNNLASLVKIKSKFNLEGLQSSIISIC